MAATIVAFFLAVGVGAHALDELHGRSLRTAIPDWGLTVAAAASLTGRSGSASSASPAPARLAVFMVAGVVLALGYNLELLGGRLHNDTTSAPPGARLGPDRLLRPDRDTRSRRRRRPLRSACRARNGTPARRRGLRRRAVAVDGRSSLRDGRTVHLDSHAPSPRSKLPCGPWRGAGGVGRRHGHSPADQVVTAYGDRERALERAAVLVPLPGALDWLAPGTNERVHRWWTGRADLLVETATTGAGPWSKMPVRCGYTTTGPRRTRPGRPQASTGGPLWGASDRTRDRWLGLVCCCASWCLGSDTTTPVYARLTATGRVGLAGRTKGARTMGFVQIIEFRTSRMDEGRKYVEDWEKATEGKRTARRGFLCQDRDDPNRYFNIVFFDSYEAAMENSKLPETEELAQKLAALTDGPPIFYDLDLVEERF